MQVIFCDDSTCKYSDGGLVCGKEDVHLKVDSSGAELFNICQDYEVKKDAGTN